MNRHEKALVILLRVSGAITLTALAACVMPLAWMQDIHRFLGMGQLPDRPIIGYLTRSLSAMYALHGAIVLFVSWDVRRYLPVIKLLAMLAIAFGAGMLWLDVTVGMPLAWTACEGPVLTVLGGVILWLAGRVRER
jgi:hypothetical protein